MIDQQGWGGPAGVVVPGTVAQPPASVDLVPDVAVDHLHAVRHVVHGVLGLPVTAAGVVELAATVPVVGGSAPAVHRRVPASLPHHGLHLGRHQVVAVPGVVIVRPTAQQVRNVSCEPDGADHDRVVLGSGEHLPVHRDRVRDVPGALDGGGPVVHQVVYIPAPHPVTPVIFAKVTFVRSKKNI